MPEEQWLALNLGNSRLHGGLFSGSVLQNTWDVPYDRYEELPFHPLIPVVIASVNPQRVTPWHSLPGTRLLSLEDVPLGGRYSTMGIDRALAAWGAVKQYGPPALVIDCGTAITLTAVDKDGQFGGGAIFPGLELLRRCLPDRVPHLPTVPFPNELPDLWGKSTPEALTSGLIHFITAGLTKFITDRGAPVIFTGGDGAYCQQFFPGSHYDPHLILWGMSSIKTSI